MPRFPKKRFWCPVSDTDFVKALLSMQYEREAGDGIDLDLRFQFARWEQQSPSYASLIESEYYDDHDIKPLIIPGLIRHADWTDLIELSLQAGDHSSRIVLAVSQPPTMALPFAGSH